MSAPVDPLVSGLLSILAALVAAGGAIYQGLAKQQADREKADRERAEKEADEERSRVSERLRRLEDKVALHDIADARHDQALSHVTSLLEEIRTDMRDVRAAVLDRPRTPGGR